MNETEWMVYVECMAYNHALYIKEALNGFCMQQTEFPFICGVIDDASTDGEPEVIQQYLEENFNLNDIEVTRRDETEDYVRVFTQHKTNKNCFFAFIHLKYNHYLIKKTKFPYISEWRKKAKYIAICEGDDYWTSPHKLQRQVDFLESHPNHSLCFHAHQSLRPDGSVGEHHRYKSDMDCCKMKDIILGGGGFMATASMVYVRYLYQDRPDWVKKSPVGDGPLMLVLAERGKVGYINESMSVYRVASSGSWTERVLLEKLKNREKHHKVQASWNGFDQWSNYKYHKYVLLKKAKNTIHYHVKRIDWLRNIVMNLKR